MESKTDIRLHIIDIEVKIKDLEENLSEVVRLISLTNKSCEKEFTPLHDYLCTEKAALLMRLHLQEKNLLRSKQNHLEILNSPEIGLIKDERI